MVTYEVYKAGAGDFHVRGLKSDQSVSDQWLFYHVPYPETETPEVTNPLDIDTMHAALYDLYQWHDGLKEGDRFTTPFGNFKCVSFHVVKDTP